VLIEARVSGKRKRLDLVLIGEKKVQFDPQDHPLLVIEVKKRRHEQLTRPYQSYLKQADEYARSIGCKYYSVHDGNTFILMQKAEPYLIGFSQESIWRREQDKQDFAGRLWNSICRIADTYDGDPVEEFRYHSDIFPWKRTIPFLIKDAFLRNAQASGWEPDEDQALEIGRVLSEKWFDVYERGSV
jgi:hypothetical protein